MTLTLRDQVNVTVVQGLPDAQKQIDFEAGLLIVKFVREIDTKHVRCQLLDVTFASFEKGTHRVSFAGVTQSQLHIHQWEGPRNRQREAPARRTELRSACSAMDAWTPG